MNTPAAGPYRPGLRELIATAIGENLALRKSPGEMSDAVQKALRDAGYTLVAPRFPCSCSRHCSGTAVRENDLCDDCEADDHCRARGSGS